MIFPMATISDNAAFGALPQGSLDLAPELPSAPIPLIYASVFVLHSLVDNVYFQSCCISSVLASQSLGNLNLSGYDVLPSKLPDKNV